MDQSISESIEKSTANLINLPDMGNHLVLDFVGVEADLNDFEWLDQQLRLVLSHTSVTIEASSHKKFEPQGVTILYLLSESHFSIHTWPEEKACTIDFYHCGSRSKSNLAIAEEKLCDLFGWKNCTSIISLHRGQTTSYLTNDFTEKTEILRNVKLLHREKTSFQEVRVYDTLSLGRIMVLDGAVQFSSSIIQSGNDNYTKDMVTSVVKPNKSYDHVVILGGGDLIVATYLLEKFPNIKKVTVCEIDNRVIEISKQFFSFDKLIDKEIENGRLEIVIQKGKEYMAKLLSEGAAVTVGAVIIDCTDFALNQSAIAAELFSPTFYKHIHQLLSDGAGFSQQITKIIYKDPFEKRTREGGFGQCTYIMSKTPEYGGDLPIAIGFKEGFS